MGETIYSNSDLAKLLGIQDSTLRKYCLVLEEAGYTFHKNENGYRGFFEKDVIVLQRLIEIKKAPDITLKRAARAVISTVDSQNVTGVVPDVITDKTPYNERNDLAILEGLLAFQKRQEEFNQALLERLDQRDQNLMKVLREIQDVKKELATSKKKKWWFFK